MKGVKIYKISEHKDEILTGLIKNLIWVPIAGAIPLIWKVIQIAYENLVSGNNAKASIVIAVIAVVLSVLSIIFTVSVRNRFGSEKTKTKEKTEKNDEEMCPLADYRINSVVAEFDINKTGDFISTLDYSIIANKSNLEYFEKSIAWTGEKCKSMELVSANSPEYKLVDVGGNDGYHIYRVVFNKLISCQEKIDFKLKTELSDPKFSMQPFYGYAVKHQIDTLTLRIVADKNTISNVRKCTYWDSGRQMQVGTPEKAVKKVIGGRDVYEIEVGNPTLLYKYFLEWDFV